MIKNAFNLFILSACLAFTGCSSGSGTFEEKKITINNLQEMLEQDETFILLAWREDCSFCAALEQYLEETGSQHSNLVLYTIDTTPFELYRDGGEASTLLSDTKDGKEFLEIFPYFLYTPALYQIRDGFVINSGIGFNENNYTVSEWDVDSTVRFDVADEVDVWTFIANGQ